MEFQFDIGKRSDYSPPKERSVRQGAEVVINRETVTAGQLEVEFTDAAACISARHTFTENGVTLLISFGLSARPLVSDSRKQQCQRASPKR